MANDDPAPGSSSPGIFDAVQARGHREREQPLGSAHVHHAAGKQRCDGAGACEPRGASIATTQRYIDVNDEMKRLAMELIRGRPERRCRAIS
jgi:hypothetical protein